jgi:hypothetical protein
MRLRVLAAAAVAAWSKTAAPTTGSVLPGVVEQPATAAVTSATAQATACTAPQWSGPTLEPGAGNKIILPPAIVVGYTSISAACIPGTLSLQDSVDQTHWNTLTDSMTTTCITAGCSQHETTTSPASVGVVGFLCTQGLSRWYRGVYVTDDHTFKGTSPQAQFSC